MKLYVDSVAARGTVKHVAAITVARLPAFGQSLLLLALIVLLAGFSIFMPVVLIFGILFLLALIPRSRGWSMTFAAFIAILLFGWMNIDKLPINDWAWYTIHYRWLQTMSLGDYLGGRFYSITIRVTEPVYHTISFVVSRLSGGSVPVLAAVVTLIIYGSVSTGIAQFALAKIRSNYEACLAVWVPLSVGITFTLTAQLVRQEIAGALAFAGFALLWAGRQKLGWFFVVAAILSHNSAAFPVACVVAAAYLLKKCRFGAITLFLLSLFGAVLGGAFLFSPGGKSYYISQQSDGQVSIAVYALDIAVLIFSLSLRRLLPDMRELADRMIAASITYFFFVIAVSPAPLLLLRFYFYVDFFRTGLLMLIVIALMRTRWAWLYGAALLVVAFLYIEARIITSPFYFRGGVLAHLLRPFAFFQ